MSSPSSPPSSTQSAWALPARFGKYTLVRKLATGGMAELYLAIMRSMAGFEKVVVLKRILPTMNQDQEFIEMLLQEARIAATLSHPNIVQTFDVGSQEGTYFIAMEHVHGDDIRGIVRQMKARSYREFPLAHAIAIMIDVCKGLSYAHEKRDLDGSPMAIVHRDISPQNVVVGFSGDAKIVDFGIAKTQSKVKLAARSEETESGKVKGKIAYMSPEQALGQDVDARSDLFAVGILLYELTTGRRLFRAKSDYETLKMICEQDVPKPSEVRPGYAPALERIVLKALERDIHTRYQSARDMQADLEAFVRNAKLEAASGSLAKFLHELYAGEPILENDVMLAPNELQQILESRQAPPVTDEPLHETSQPSAIAAAHTVPDARTLPAQRSKRTLAVGAALGIAASFGVAWLYSQNESHAGAESGQGEVAIERATLRVTSEPSDGTVWIDGALHSERTPTTISGLPRGRAVDLRITRDGFEPFVQSVALDEAEQSLSANLERGTLSARVVVSPASATLSLDGVKLNASGTALDQDRVEFKLSDLASSSSHELKVEASGYLAKTLSFTGSAFETTDLTVSLSREPSAPALPPAGAGKAHGKPNALKDDTAAAAPKGGNGKLNVGASNGWCNVSIDGQARGATPLAGLELPAGPHKVTCTTPDGATHTSSVRVSADEVARVKFTL